VDKGFLILASRGENLEKLVRFGVWCMFGGYLSLAEKRKEDRQGRLAIARSGAFSMAFWPASGAIMID